MPRPSPSPKGKVVVAPKRIKEIQASPVMKPKAIQGQAPASAQSDNGAGAAAACAPSATPLPAPATLTVKEAAFRLGKSNDTVRYWLRTGRLKGWQPGGRKCALAVLETSVAMAQSWPAEARKELAT